MNQKADYDHKYWKKRSDMVYYRTVSLMVGYVGRNAKTVIDVGARDAQYIEEFDWIPEKYTLDIATPYSSETVTGIQEDFFTYSPERKFDLVLCLQVLEHIKEAEKFAKKLLETGKRLVVSVPYCWPENATKHHVQDPVDEKKLASWFNRKPDYQIVVEEPFKALKTGRRLIAYYHDDPASFDMKAIRTGKSKG